ncbi:MAG: aldo/keto reductase [Verrucomicrobiales bacterium]|jgi:D-xylose reductase|nr:aldo/keto reductase [Verrucomicrobiales bacterium]
MSKSLETLATYDGGQFPTIGLGTWKIPDEVLPTLIPDAVEVGYRHFDCACDYGNEPAVGEGIKNAISGGKVSRDDLWITSKLWNTYHEPKHVRAACERSLNDLGLEELDLYLIHFPITLAYVPFEERYPPGWFFDPEAENPSMKHIDVPYADTWGAMEELVDAGLVKRIGVCNLGTAMLRDLKSYARIQPAVNQVEMHPYLTQDNLLRYCQDAGIAVTAFSPFGASSYVPLSMADENESLFDDPVIQEIGKAHRKTVGQVALRWGVQRGTVTIPKTQTVAHLRENLDIYDFELSEGEMLTIDQMNRDRRFNDPAEFGEAAFNTFYPIFD